MKKTVCLCAAALCLLLLSSCFAGNTTTDYARNHVYGLGEAIHFYDEKNDRDPLGTLTFLSVYVLSNDAFTLKERDGAKDGQPAYKEVTYSQLVQINYTYQSAAEKSPRSYAVYDSAGSRGVLNPGVPYDKIPVDDGVGCLIAALPARGDSVRVEVLYSGVFAPNAVANLTIEGKTPAPERPTSPAGQNGQAMALLQAQLDEQQQRILSLGEQLGKKQNQITVLVILLSTVSSVLLMLLWQQLRNRKKS